MLLFKLSLRRQTAETLHQHHIYAKPFDKYTALFVRHRCLCLHLNAQPSLMKTRRGWTRSTVRVRSPSGARALRVRVRRPCEGSGAASAGAGVPALRCATAAFQGGLHHKFVLPPAWCIPRLGWRGVGKVGRGAVTAGALVVCLLLSSISETK